MGKLKEFTDLQKKLSLAVDLRDKLKKVRTIAGADVSYSGNWACVCACTLDFKSLECIEKVIIHERITFPYISGYLCFREGPVVIKAVSKLKRRVDCFLFDGNGLLHQRGMGLATFIGAAIKKPSIGCAKSLLLGKYTPPGKSKGNFSFIEHKGKKLGIALRTKTDVKEIFVSIAWGISLEKAKKIVLSVSEYRIPEPLRLAHIHSKKSI